MVDGIGRRLNHVDGPEARVDAVENAIQHVSGEAVDIHRIVEVVARRPNVIDVENRFPEELMLHTEEPVVNVRSSQVRIYGLDGGARTANPVTAVQTQAAEPDRPDNLHSISKDHPASK